jgi:hypothetical protein
MTHYQLPNQSMTDTYPHLDSLKTLLSEKRSSYRLPSKANLSEVEEPITTASPEIKQIIERVLQLEKDRLYTRNARGINDDILRIIQEAIPR